MEKSHKITKQRTDRYFPEVRKEKQVSPIIKEHMRDFDCCGNSPSS